jgi:hypothetical protein
MHSSITEFFSDETVFADKLKHYKEVKGDALTKDMHFRYTCNKYKETGRKVAYAVVQKVDTAEGLLWVNGYSPDGNHQFPDWKIDIKNKYKMYRFYIKADLCLGCSRQYTMCKC